MNQNGDLQINLATYAWTSRIFSILKKFLRVNMELHHKEVVEAGEIFLFNHFARFETFIPQYLIYQETGAFCRSVASSDFFVEQSAFSNYLKNVGAVPNNHPRLLAFLAEEILRGRKVIVFPEGGMVKDRRVLDHRGRYRIYSRAAETWRKHHTGAAVLALALDLYKRTILKAYEKGDLKRVETLSESLQLDKWALLAAAHRPTLIVPSNITFYPIRVGDNLLRKVGEALNKGLSRRMSEELEIEGNILLRDTDMDVRLGEPVAPAEFWRWCDDKLITHLLAGKFDSLDVLFGHSSNGGGFNKRMLGSLIRRNSLHIRDQYMHRMYASVTVNLSHLASQLILSYMDKGKTDIDHETFHKALYLAVKKVQREPSVHLHRSLRNPVAYRGVMDGDCPGLDQFVKTATAMDLIEGDKEGYRFLSKLREEHQFDEIRLENLVVVYANEVAPIPGVMRAVKQAMDEASRLDSRKLARLTFDDQVVGYTWDRQSFAKPVHKEINEQETATESGEPFLLLPKKAKDLGVVLVHGLLATPVEVRALGEKLESLGYPVVGVRLKGHGTSPWDLRERSWEDWMRSVRQGYDIMSALTNRIALVGFSTGGSLVLRLAADGPEGLAGVVAVSAPLKVRDRNMIFVPLVHGANRMLGWVPAFEGIMPFRSMHSEHPHINYRNVPIRCLYELRRLIDTMEERLPDIKCPVSLIQGTEDPLVEPISAEIIHKKLRTDRKDLVMVTSKRHGIIYEDIGVTHETVIQQLETLSGSAQGKGMHTAVSLGKSRGFRGPEPV
ncbi:MAG: alpha/beta fold hydrolase [Deltaproteobacteria bacterium]|nr:alpha/beta fold hydrolase [Deltaproteobacteria bacterium]